VFRAGLEDATAGRVALASLVFGLAHLVMLVPVGAALAIGVAGAVYARIYRRAHAAAATQGGARAPAVVRRTYRPTRRARAAAARARGTASVVAWTELLAVDGPASMLRADPDPEGQQAAGVFAAAVWHTTFNSMLVVLVWLGFAFAALSPAG
jgi:hypothetical protein